MVDMETGEALRWRVQHMRRLMERLRTATVRMADARRERTWAIVSAHQQGLSIRRIGAATGLSAARVHQLLANSEAVDIPAWLSRVREWDWPTTDPNEVLSQPATIASALAAEVAALRQCIDWLEQAERGETVMVNLRPVTDSGTEFVIFDQSHIRRVLARIAADLDALAATSTALASLPTSDVKDIQDQHR